jgi:hypothetical protein
VKVFAVVGAVIGWIGAVFTSLVVAVIALGTGDEGIRRATHLMLEPLGWYTLVPLSAASLATGVVQSLGTRWGLLRHYWVIVKLAMNVLATGVLLLYMRTLADLSGTARTATTVVPTPSPVIHAAAAVALLLVALVLSVYKPRGRTPVGARPLR